MRGATAARSPASTATGSRAPSSCRRCSATELVEAFREFKAIWDPRVEDEPGQGGRPVPHRREPAPRRRLRAAASPRRTSASADDDGSFAPRHRCAASASASAGASEGGTMCPSYMVTREEKHSTRGRARLLFEMLRGRSAQGRLEETSTSRRRSTSAWPARAARATARSTWTWPPTRPSSSRTTTRAACARGTPTRWASSWSGRGSPRCVPRLANFVTQTPGLARWRSSRRDRAAARGPALRARHLPALVPSAAAAAAADGQARWCSGPTPSTTTSTRRPPTPRSRCSRRPGCEVDDPAALALLRPAALRLRHARPRAAALDGLLDVLAPRVAAGVPVVGLEPSCLAVFRDELADLLPHDPTGQARWPRPR